jgi:protein required for attachment to host cells
VCFFVSLPLIKRQGGIMKKNPHIEFKPNVRWYLVANRAEAVIYRSSKDVKFKFVERFKHPESRVLEGDLDSDRPGTGFSSAGGGTIRHGLDRTFFHHEQASRQFAKILARHLDRTASEELYSELVLVSEPHFLGLLRAELSERVKRLISHEINREYSQGSDHEVHSLILQAIEAR